MSTEGLLQLLQRVKELTAATDEIGLAIDRMTRSIAACSPASAEYKELVQDALRLIREKRRQTATRTGLIDEATALVRETGDAEAAAWGATVAPHLAEIAEADRESNAAGDELLRAFEELEALIVERPDGSTGVLAHDEARR